MSAPSESSVFQALFQAACKEYAGRTGTDPDQHPLSLQLQVCDSFASLISLLQEQAQAFDKSRDGDKSGGYDGPPGLVNLIESITNFLRRLDIYIKIPPTAAMTEIVVKILVELLSTLAFAVKQTREKGIVAGDEVEALFQRVDQLTQDEARTTAAQTFQAVYGLVQNMRVVMDECKTSTDSVQEALAIMQEFAIGMNDSKREKSQEAIQTWLSPPDPCENHDIALKAHRDGTSACKWFVQGDTFAEWKSSGSLLWIHGKLGCGKTILCSAIIEEIDWMRKASLASLAFFYFDRSDDKRKGLRGLLTSLIFQLHDQSDSYLKILSDFYSAHSRGSKNPNNAALTQCLKNMLCCPGQPPIYIILDGIDGCPKSSGRFPPREAVLMFLEELVGLHLPNLRICVSSRLEFDITTVISPLALHSISLHDEPGQKEEIVEYVKSIVDSKPGARNWAVEDKKLVIDQVLQKGDGMFRWISCQLDVLPSCFSPCIQSILGEVPETLGSVYEQALEEIPSAHWGCARSLLGFVLVSFRSPLVEELAEFLALDLHAGSIRKAGHGWRPKDPEEALLSMCSGLLSIVEVNGSKIVQFTHPSVKEFLISRSLTKTGDGSSRRQLDVGHMHNMIVKASLALLLSLDGEVTKESSKDFPLANYAARHWVDHIQSENVPQLLESAAKSDIQLLLDPNKQHFTFWISAFNMYGNMPPHLCTKTTSQVNGTSSHYPTMYGYTDVGTFAYNARSGYGYDGLQRNTPLTVASALGHIEIVRQQISYPSSGNNGSALHLASRGGHLDVVQLLLGKGTYYVATKDSSGQTPLHYASQAGHLEVVQFLLDRRADVKVLNNSGHTPLHYALQEGRLEVAQLLLERGADPNALDRNGHTPLYWALQGGRLEAIHLLLKCGAHVNRKSGNDGSPLHWALQEGRLDFAQLLLEPECGADVGSKDSLGRTPLHVAMKGGCQGLTQLLLERGADANAGDNNKQTPLHGASQGGYTEVVQLFLEHGGNVNARDSSSRTPLHSALQEGHLEVAQLLLERGADANARDVSNRTLLHWALQEGHLEVAELLLECGADANVQDGGGRTPFGWALQEGRLDVVRLLLEHGKNTDIRDQAGRTSLLWALQEGRLDVAELLLERGENVDTRNGSERTPLHTASQDGHLEVAEFLLEHGANANTHDDGGQTPLHVASQGGHFQVTQLLLTRGAYPNSRDGSQRTPLHLASQTGCLEVAELLLDHGAYPNARDENKRTPMHSVMEGGRLELIQLLLNRGAYMNTPDTSGQTPLHLASREGHLEIAQLLLDSGVYADTWDGSNRTPLHWASQGGHLEVTRLLLERDADTNARDNGGRTPLHLASQAGGVEISELLLDRGADANAQNDIGQTPLHLASREGHRHVVQSLLARPVSGIDVRNYEGRIASQEATAGGHHDIAQLLLRHGG